MPTSRTAMVHLVVVAAVALANVVTAQPASAQSPQPSPTQAVTAKPIPNPKSWATDFYTKFLQNNDEAFEMVRTAGIPPAGMDSLRQTTARLSAVVGAPQSAVLLDDQHAGASVWRLTFVVQHQRGPVAHNLIFYQPPQAKDWLLVGMEVIGEPARFPFKPTK